MGVGLRVDSIDAGQVFSVAFCVNLWDTVVVIV